MVILSHMFEMQKSLFDVEMEASTRFDSSSGHLDHHQKSVKQEDDFSSAQQSLYPTTFNMIQLTLALGLTV